MASDRRLAIAARQPSRPVGVNQGLTMAASTLAERDEVTALRERALAAALFYTWQPRHARQLAEVCGLDADDVRRGAQLVKLLRDTKEGCRE
jgi:hypothetical protein